MMLVNIKQVDAFTNIPFGGNPAGVVTEADGLDDEIKQKIAREMNLSETAFVSKSDAADFKIQFFTPRFELDLAGHPTIAVFSVLDEEGKLDTDKSIYYQETKAGILPVERKKINDKEVFMMTQASPKFKEVKIDRSEAAGFLGLDEEDISELPIVKVSTGIWWIVIGVKKLEKLVSLKPDLKVIEAVSREFNAVGVTPFCIDSLNKSYDYHIRAFAPLAGVSEDPVCGTGNGCVSSYIVKNGLIECGKAVNLIGEQGNEVDRPGCVYVNIKKNSGSIEEVKIGGTAVTILDGNMVF